MFRDRVHNPPQAILENRCKLSQSIDKGYQGFYGNKCNRRLYELWKDSNNTNVECRTVIYTTLFLGSLHRLD